MLGDDALHLLHRQFVVPCLLGVDQRCRSPLTDSQAIRFGPVDPVERIGVTEFAQAFLEVVPDLGAAAVGMTLRLRRCGTEEDVPLDGVVGLSTARAQLGNGASLSYCQAVWTGSYNG